MRLVTTISGSTDVEQFIIAVGQHLSRQSVVPRDPTWL